MAKKEIVDGAQRIYDELVQKVGAEAAEGEDAMTTLARLDFEHKRYWDERAVKESRERRAGALFAASDDDDESAATDCAEFTLNGQRVRYRTGTLDNYILLKALRTGLSEREEADWQRLRTSQAGGDAAAPETKLMTVRDDTTGGYLVSAEFAAGILHRMVDASPARQVSRVRLLGPASALVQPVRTNQPAAFHVSEVQSGRFDTSLDETFGAENIPVHEVCVPVLVSRALVQDAGYDLEAELQQTFADSLAVLEGAEFISGTGSSQMLGLDNATLPAANVVTGADSTGHLIAPDDILKLLYGSGLKQSYIPGARLLMSPKTFGSLLATKGTSSAPGYLVNPTVTGPSLFGVPVTFAPEMPDVTSSPAAGKKAVYLLNPIGYQMAIRTDVSVLRLNQRYAEQGLIAFYFYARIGGQPTLPEAIGLLKTA